MELVEKLSLTTRLLGNVVENKNFGLRIKNPRSSKKIACKVLGHGSPTDVAEVELVKLVDVVEVDLASSPTNIPSINPTNKSRDLVPRTSPMNKLLEEGSKVRPLH